MVSMVARTRFRNRVAPVADGSNNQPEADLEAIDLSRLGFSECETEEEQLNQMKKLREMPYPLDSKRIIRKRILKQQVRVMGGFRGWKTRREMERKKCSLLCKNFVYKLELWRQSFKEIEGHFGSGVLSYFLFLKWLFLLDLLVAFLITVFIIAPQLSFKETDSTYVEPCLLSTAKNYTSLYGDMDWEGELVSNCSAYYSSYITEKSSVSNVSNAALKYVADFFQGTGFMEDTVLFYGYYSSIDLQISDQLFIKQYDLPLAYILVTALCFLLSLILMVRQSAKGFDDAVAVGDERTSRYGNKIFGAWDFALTDGGNIQLKKRSILQDIKHDMADERDKVRRQNRTRKQLCGLFFLRLIINLFVIAVLGGSGYLIFYITQLSNEIIQIWPEYATWNAAIKFLIEFLPSLTITLLNIAVPVIFGKVVIGEDYKSSTEIIITLIRTVFLRLASLGVLLATLYSNITCSSKDECNVGVQPACQQLYCWETSIGQQIYKLIITDFFVGLISSILIEFPRKLIVSKCDCKLSRLIGPQEFIIPKNVLDLVYAQTLCWLGAFFSPLIPAICAAKFFFLFYFKKISLLSNFVPNKRPYRASKSNSQFIFVLIISFVICCFAVVYVITSMEPSRGCGPFRPYTKMYDAIRATICDWPNEFQYFLHIITSESFNIPAFFVLSLAIYYMSVSSRAQKRRIEMLSAQLSSEVREKQLLLEISRGTVAQNEQIRQEQHNLTQRKKIGTNNANAKVSTEREKSFPPGAVDYPV